MFITLPLSVVCRTYLIIRNSNTFVFSSMFCQLFHLLLVSFVYTSFAFAYCLLSLVCCHLLWLFVDVITRVVFRVFDSFLFVFFLLLHSFSLCLYLRFRCWLVFYLSLSLFFGWWFFFSFFLSVPNLWICIIVTMNSTRLQYDLFFSFAQ